MTIAIKFGDLEKEEENTALIFIDAVTSLKEVYSGRVTEHPIAVGANITDHFGSNNIKIDVEGVISGTDLSPVPIMINVDGKTPMNANLPSDPVVVSDLGGGLMSLLPDSISQFFPTMGSDVIGGDMPREDFSALVKEKLKNIMTGIVFNKERNRWESQMTLATLYSIDTHGIATQEFENCVLTNWDLRETPETGDAMFLSLSFEVVRFANLEVVGAAEPEEGTPEARGNADEVTQPEVTGTPSPPPPPQRQYSRGVARGTSDPDNTGQ